MVAQCGSFGIVFHKNRRMQINVSQNLKRNENKTNERELTKTKEQKLHLREEKGIAPVYLQGLCRPVSTLVGRQAFGSSSGGKHLVPSVNTSTMQHRTFSVVTPSTQ